MVLCAEHGVHAATDVPVFTCANATLSRRVVVFKESDKTLAYVNKNCIIFLGKDGETGDCLEDRRISAVLSTKVSATFLK